MDEEILEKAGEIEVALVRDIVRTITKTVKTFNVYPKDNPIYQKFAGELFAKFKEFFELAEELPLDIGQNSLQYRDNTVFQSEEKTDNLAMLMYADGLRQISFQKGISFEEITDFIDILRMAPKAETSDDDDIVTLLWEKNIRNMGYTAVEDTVEDEFVVEEGLLLEGAELASDEGGSAGITQSEGVAQQTVTSREVVPPREDEIQTLKEELSGIGENYLLSAAVELFYDFLASGHDTGAAGLLVQNLGRIVNLRMQHKDIERTLKILGGLKEVLKSYQPDDRQKMFAEVASNAGSTENLRILFRESRNAQEIRNYLLLLGKEQVPNMIQMLGVLDDRRQRRLLCEVLAELCSDSPEPLVQALTDERWYLVRNVAMIIGMTKNPDAAKYLGSIINHHDARVRREIVRALEVTDSEYAKKLFPFMFNDPDQTVRLGAIKAVRRFKDPALYKNFRDLAASEGFQEKPFAEKKEIIETLTSLGGQEAFPLVAGFFRKRGFIEKDEITELRAAAAYGLANIGTEEAISLLEKETGSRKDLLRKACIAALKEARRGNVRK